MSDILIKGMEMPTSCRKCGLMMNCDDCEGWECYCLPLKKSIGHLERFRDEPYVPTDKRRDDCPLILVPEHGRLVDADALVRSYYHAPSFPNLCKAINEAPTIIPADKEAGEC